MGMMLFLVSYFVGGSLLYFGVRYAVRQHYRPYWVQEGREWRMRGYAPFVSQAAWIQKFFDEGYYELDRIAEGE